MLDKRGRAVSSLITISVIAILLFATTANAVNISVSPNKDQYTASETITFSVSINIDTDERIPIDSLKLQIFDNSLPFLKECIFKPDGTKVSGCNNIVIAQSGGNYGTSEKLYGYGYDENNNYQGTFFGYGYGYGGTGYGYQGILSYTITWTPSADGVTAGNFKAALKINSVGELDSYVYNKDSDAFSVGSCINGDTKPCGSSNIGVCKYGTQTCVSGQWSSCTGAVEPTTEICNAKDDDCDNLIDENLITESSTGSNVGECKKEKYECITGSWVKTQSAVGPTNEICNNKDDDCDGLTDEGNVCVTYYCTGTTPANSQLCANDDSGLTADTARALKDYCSSQKCEYTCNSGYVKSGNSCTKETPYTPPPVTPPVTTTYSCTGTAPANADLCANDDSGLTANTARALKNSCGAAKCEYVCSSEYKKSGSECVLKVQPTCTGTIPANSQLCTGDSTGLTANTGRALVTACTSAAKCEYICPSGYTKSGDSCILQTPALCTGLIPSHSQLCAGDNQGLTANTGRSLKDSCGAAKCEYVCSSGYVKTGNACIIPIPPTPNQCNDKLDNDNDGFTDLNDLDCSSLTDNTESGSLQVCKPATTAICGVGGRKTCQSTGIWGACIGSQQPKLEVKQDVLIPVITQVVETLQQAEQTLSRIETNKEETGFELSLSTNEQQTGSISVKVYDQVPAEQSFTIPGLKKQKFIVIEPEEQIENDVKQALLKLNYDENDLDIPESELRMYYYNEKTGEWVQEPNSGVNTEENYVWAITNHLSLFTMAKKSTSTTGLTKYYYDSDGDGYGTNDYRELNHKTGYYRALQSGDCYDAEILIYPGAKEFYNNRDDNCNGLKDETFPSNPDSTRYYNPTINGLPVDWHVAVSPDEKKEYIDHSGLLAAELYCQSSYYLEYQPYAYHWVQYNSIGAKSFKLKLTTNEKTAPDGTYVFYKPVENGEIGFENENGKWVFEWIECLKIPKETALILPNMIEDPKPKTLHRTINDCATHQELSPESIIRLDTYYFNHTHYTNYQCTSRFYEQCISDGSFDTYYEEWCEY